LLYVEDDSDLIKVVTALLSDIAELSVATTVSEARKMLKNGAFDLVILDVGLPDGSGFDLLPLLKRDETRSTPVILFSGEEVDGKVAKQVEAALVKSRTSNRKLLKTIKRLIDAEKSAVSTRGKPT
jgi:DNA-binding response OmpR family regulator